MLHSRDGDAGWAHFCGVRSRQRTIYFAIDSAVPKSGLDATAAAMRSAFADEQLVITGHADDPGPAYFNNRLALARAEQVALELISEGLGYERLILANLDRGCPQRITDPGLSSPTIGV